MTCGCAFCPCGGVKEEAVFEGGCDYCAALDLSGVFTPHTCADYRMEDECD